MTKKKDNSDAIPDNAVIFGDICITVDNMCWTVANIAIVQDEDRGGKKNDNAGNRYRSGYKYHTNLGQALMDVADRLGKEHIGDVGALIRAWNDLEELSKRLVKYYAK